MKPDWSRAPAWAYAFAQVVYEHASDAKDFAWISKDGYIIASPQYLNDTCWPYSEENFGASSFRVLQYRPESLPINNSHSASKADLVFAALVDCVTVMERDLNGLALIQPELKQAKQAIDLVEIVDADFVEWNGEGLPPVGTVCEFAGGEDCPHDPWDKDLRVGDQVTIIAHFDSGHGDQLAAFTFPTKNPNRGAINVEQGRWGCFRPLSTPEQIAAEERESNILELADELSNYQERETGHTHKKLAGYLYDHGYRKQVTP